MYNYLDFKLLEKKNNKELLDTIEEAKEYYIEVVEEFKNQEEIAEKERNNPLLYQSLLPNVENFTRMLSIIESYIKKADSLVTKKVEYKPLTIKKRVPTLKINKINKINL